MPLYEYVCRSCTHPFEELVSGSADPACPRCSAADVARVLSRTVVGRAGSTEAAALPAPCGRCGNPAGPGSCAFDD